MKDDRRKQGSRKAERKKETNKGKREGRQNKWENRGKKVRKREGKNWKDRQKKGKGMKQRMRKRKPEDYNTVEDMIIRMDTTCGQKCVMILYDQCLLLSTTFIYGNIFSYTVSYNSIISQGSKKVDSRQYMLPPRCSCTFLWPVKFWKLKWCQKQILPIKQAWTIIVTVGLPSM